MKRRGWIYVAVAVYLVGMVLCLAFPQHVPAVAVATAPAGLIKVDVAAGSIRGVGMQIQNVDWVDVSTDAAKVLGHGGYKDGIDQIKAMGATYVLLSVEAHQENGGSSKLYLDIRQTPSIDQVGELIDYAHKAGLKVVLMPVVTLDVPREGEGRASIVPASWEDWFESYRGITGHFAIIAEAHQAEVLVVGSQLDSTMGKLDQWERTIYNIKEKYHGTVTYMASWDHYLETPFWGEMDVIGMNSFWRLGDDQNVSADEVAAKWGVIQKQLKKFCEDQDKKLLFLQAGWGSASNAAREPESNLAEGAVADADLQARLWKGFFKAWQGSDWLAGYVVWDWAPGKVSAGDRGYTVKDKPAYEVVKAGLEAAQEK